SPVSVLQHSRVVFLEEILSASEDHRSRRHGCNSPSEPVGRGTEVESVNGAKRTDDDNEESDHF
ncbi:hypothetical protein PMAYCL1PPCAC_11642, partial [Pristionchus mayeri]